MAADSCESELDRWIEGLRKPAPEYLTERDLKRVCESVKTILIEENNVQHVSSPVVICGDIHGQYFDLLELFHIGGQVPKSKYVFMGDFVDRGFNSVETLQLLLVLKLRWPEHITLLRGNHESRQITQVYGFYDECVRKYGNMNPWKYCTDVFDYLTIAALVDGQVLCLHGGLSPDVKFIDQMRLIMRVQEIPHEGPFGDIVWSDPDDVLTWAINPRGAGWLFGANVCKEFCHLNDLSLIARAHQLVQEGYQYKFEHRLVTVWSAPNYCYRCGNVAAIMNVMDSERRTFEVFKEVESTNQKPATLAVPYFL
uniref:Serine/threonine-protein phosphatase n=1 Tax=Chromera velia CCMP2878 TaxID=1169474 RepID=A0A0G4IC55_9ALVE|mmetsp:Transcript_47325/g.93373  ORF Transcript_47325/g.93373 Transcript_47325/m.93373 type:complete len:311 (-) Transcript_47325:287-1219(-)|eukprot:Cvel_13020.t1-p1 / transcript=Cvel_13020.t1 / gene=Cvel_13020 / organism=Chromera_velia_CCMP2878 / gene_product=Serine/threonine-protein phosphatase 6 catalytic, putative / transcript_product=Serine/threonine-protein phosphatase 6 catalytic, putative / location=Cvel_scaffold874:14876-19342(+) / protein_length=310 / sequence_SO=supercontig / SO=protein_coding / is_pseudo=false